MAIVFVVAMCFSGLVFPSKAYADGELTSITVTPEEGIIPAIGQTIEYTALAYYAGQLDPVDVTDSATWAINNPGIASNDGEGKFTGKASGDTWVSASYGGAVSWAGLSLWAPGMNVGPGKPEEPSYFDIWANNCKDLSWSLVVNNGSADIVTLGGIILNNNWYNSYNYPLPEGNYTATFSVGGIVQATKTFSVKEFESSLTTSVGYAGETTTFTLKASNSSGGTAYFLLRKVIDDFYYEFVYDEDIPIGSNDWSYEINQTLTEGRYSVYFTVNDAIAGGDDFSVVNRPSPAPKPLTPEEQASLDLSIERQVAIYGANNVGFVKTLYDNILGRAADEGGLNDWVTALNEGRITLRDVVFGFVFSKELEPVVSPAGPEEYITFLYENVLGRSPDPDGLNSWITNMQQGMTKEEVLLHFVDSEEFNKICEMFGL